jgi:glycerate 2-kinase
MTTEERREFLLNIIRKSLEEMNPGQAVKKNLEYDEENRVLDIAGQKVELGEGQKVWITGVGKAAVTMAKAAGKILGSRLAEGLVIAPDQPEEKLDRIQVLKGSHPIPDKESLSSTYELLHFAKSIPDEAPVLCMLSGGASALLCMPDGQLEIEDVGTLHKMLLESGMDIHQMNTVRKVVSRVKAGGLLRALAHTQLFDLVISDVPGDNLSSIGSGPTTFEEKQFDEAFRLLKQYELWNRLPHQVRVYIARGMHEPVDHTAPDPFRHHSEIISSAGMLADKTAAELEKNGVDARVIHPAYNDSIENVEKKILQELNIVLEGRQGYLKNSEESQNGEGSPAGENPKKQALIFYGESSVNVSGSGKGGRNQELALRIAMHLNDAAPVSFASIGTDGVDGPTDSAGALVDETTIRSAESQQINPASYLGNNDSYAFFNKAGGHIKTGPTGNNLMDLQVLLISN